MVFINKAVFSVIYELRLKKQLSLENRTKIVNVPASDITR